MGSLEYFWVRIEKSRAVFFGHCTYREAQLKNDVYGHASHVLIDLKGGKIEKQRLYDWYNQNHIPKEDREGIKDLIIRELKDKRVIKS